MSDRYTRRDAQNAFQALAQATGAIIPDPTWPISDPRREGAWKLDYNSVYGGFRIVAYCKDSPPREGDTRPQSYTSETDIFGAERLPAREFSQRCRFAVRAIALAKS